MGLSFPGGPVRARDRRPGARSHGLTGQAKGADADGRHGPLTPEPKSARGEGLQTDTRECAGRGWWPWLSTQPAQRLPRQRQSRCEACPETRSPCREPVGLNRSVLGRDVGSKTGRLRPLQVFPALTLEELLQVEAFKAVIVARVRDRHLAWSLPALLSDHEHG